jgi:hypothetical protein
MKNEELYWRIDAEEDMTDAEKRETYFAEIENEEDEKRWQDEQSGF